MNINNQNLSYRNEMISFELKDNNSDKLLVILPGLSYSLDAPALYYAYNVGVDLQYDVLQMKYQFTEMGENNERGDLNDLVSACQNVVNQVLASSEYKEVVFYAKSIGTLITSKLIESYQTRYSIKLVYVTPMKEVLPKIGELDCLIIIGTNDGFVDQNDLGLVETVDNIDLHLVEGANHYLDCDSVETTVAEMSKMIIRAKTFINVKGKRK